MAGLAMDVRGSFGSFEARFATELPSEGITVILGPSGAGKTTLLRIVSGLEAEATGSIRMNGESWLDTARNWFVPPHRRGVGYVFQDGRLFPHLNVAGNLDYAERRRRTGAAPDRRHIERVFDIADIPGRDVATLSGGEAQRVTIARALLTNPKLLVMDEPLSALDLPRRAEALRYIEAVPRTFGIPVIYVTHAIEEAAQLASTLVVVDHGAVVANGPTSDIMARLDLSQLLGHFEAGTVLEGTIEGEDAQFGLSLVAIEGTTFQIPRVERATGSPIRLRIRARDVSLALSPPREISIRNIIAAKVTEVVEEQGTAFAEVRLIAGSQALRARLTRRSVHELGLAPGSAVHALIKSIAVDRQLDSGDRR